MDLKITIVMCVTAVLVFAVMFGRPFSVSYKGLQAAMQQTKEIHEAVGKTNGDGTLSQMNERLLAESAETKKALSDGLAAVNARLDERTHIVRRGASEPEDLASYTQSRMHDILDGLARNQMMTDLMWKAMQSHGFDLPDMPSWNEQENK
jgi:hypothetical protein